MTLYRVSSDRLEVVPATSFVSAGVFERRDIQRLLKADISPLGDDLMVIAEEYGNWEDSNRRIDLLCLDKQARLVVVEIKRTEDGGHMELQAIRYAAMVSSMTLEQVIDARAKTLIGEDSLATARSEILEFLGGDAVEEVELTGDVRIILVSANFSSELTTAVMWLNKYDLDIVCIRLKPYKLGEQLLIDATQIIPLPEAADYEVKVRAQAQETRKARGMRQEIFRKFWSQLIERSKATTQILAGRTGTDGSWLAAGIGRSGIWLALSLTEERARIECYIGMKDEERNIAAFNALKAQRESIEEAFGGALEWQDLPKRNGCRVCVHIDGGWRLAEMNWPTLQAQMIDALIRLEAALKGHVQKL